MEEEVVFSVSDFVAVFNQTVEYVYPPVTIVGELSNFKISKGKWIYFDLKDDYSSVRFFGTVFALPGPLEEGMLVRVTGVPRLYQTFGFSITVRTILPVGEGALKKAADLLKAKLTKEGLFEPSRKRSILYPPTRIGLVASGESAAYVDFLKVLNARWGGVEIIHAESQVQGELAIEQVVSAIQRLNEEADLDVIVITRGGGSADDLAVFSTEQVTRAIASSRVPTLAAIGHEIDESLAELAADVRASTPSNAAELLVPDKVATHRHIAVEVQAMQAHVQHVIQAQRAYSENDVQLLRTKTLAVIHSSQLWLTQKCTQLEAYNPTNVLRRGYAIVRNQTSVVRATSDVTVGDTLDIRFFDGSAQVTVKKVY